MRAGEAAGEELSHLEGEELCCQTRQVTGFLHIATEQKKNQRYAINILRASHTHGAAGNDRDGPRATDESSSPAPSRHRDSQATHDSSSWTSRLRSGASGHSRPPLSRNQEHNTERPTPRRPHRPAPEASGARQLAHSRLDPRVEPVDARDRLDRLVESRITEEEEPAGPRCFGPRILGEPLIDDIQLLRDTSKYDGTAKLEDWLLDYTTAVGITKGNKRWAVRNSPLMLIGSPAPSSTTCQPAVSTAGWISWKISSATSSAPITGRAAPNNWKCASRAWMRRTAHT
jgi:hypothetical protein